MPTEQAISNGFLGAEIVFTIWMVFISVQLMRLVDAVKKIGKRDAD